MDFSNTTSYNGLLQQCEINLFGDQPFGSITAHPDRLKIFTSYINDAYNRYAVIALTADNSWQFDDNNYSDFPIAITDIVAGQPDYTLNTEQIIIDQVEIIDNTGVTWTDIPEMDERMFAEKHVSLTQWNNNIAGIPTQHAKIANSIYLYPTPNYNQTGGLKVRFKRAPDYFTFTDTTKEPGIVRLHHNYLSDYATWKYAMSRGMPIQKTYQDVVVRWEQIDIPTHYADRSLEKPTTLTAIRRPVR